MKRTDEDGGAQWQGAHDKEFPTGVSIFEGIQNATSSARVTFNQGVTFDDVIDIQSVVNDAQTADVIVLCLGEAPEAEGEGDINDLTLSLRTNTEIPKFQSS